MIVNEARPGMRIRLNARSRQTKSHRVWIVYDVQHDHIKAMWESKRKIIFPRELNAWEEVVKVVQ